MIEFINVTKTYDNGTKAIDNLNLKINKGEFVFILGNSGAGKSTVLKLLMAEEFVSSGEIILNNKKFSQLKKKEIPYLRRTMGVVFQDFRLINSMTVYDNVAFAMHVIGENTDRINKRVPYILEIMGLTGKYNCLPSEISGGEQQRVGLARALVNNPSIIIADEPTGNIDPQTSSEIIELLNEVNSQGATVLMVTHEHSLISQFNKRVIKIHQGKLVSDSKNVEGKHEI